MACTAICPPTTTQPAMLNALAVETATPYVDQFTGHNGSKTAHDAARLVNNVSPHET